MNINDNSQQEILEIGFARGQLERKDDEQSNPSETQSSVATNSKPSEVLNKNSAQKSKIEIEKYKKELKQVYANAENNTFSKVLFTVAGTKRKYTQINYFFTGPTEFEEEPDEKQTFSYKCKICIINGYFNHKPIECALGKFSYII